MLWFNKLVDNPERSFFGRAANVFAGFGFSVFWIPIIAFIINYFRLPIHPHQASLNPLELNLVFYSVIIAPLWEELAFRVGPLMLTRRIARGLNDNGILLAGVIISSAIFGWMHNDGANSILMQGVMGFVMALVYIRNGFNYWSSVIVHALWNYSIIFALPYLVSH